MCNDLGSSHCDDKQQQQQRQGSASMVAHIFRLFGRTGKLLQQGLARAGGVVGALACVLLVAFSTSAVQNLGEL